MYQALYRKYRPQTFDDVVGQLAVTQTLKNQMITGHLSHAYLFTGSRGTGKTTCAKILAKAVNCENPVDGNPCNACPACRGIDSGSVLDVQEIDAASNNGVDNVRAIRDEAIYPPAEVKKRVYIIDEVHMLSISAFNALLKIIEEPPEHLLFILATTELSKVPATILSRCQRFSFRRLLPEDIAGRIQTVAYREEIDLEAEAAELLGRLADGALRDGLSLLDQCASAGTGKLTVDGVYAALGLAGSRQTAALMEAIAAQDVPGALKVFSDLYGAGKDAAAMLGELSTLARDILVTKTAPQAGLSMISSTCTAAEVRALAPRFSPQELLRMVRVVQETLSGLKGSGNQRMDGELCLMNLCEPALRLDEESLSARIGRVEEQLAAGVILGRPAASPAQETEAPADVSSSPPWDDGDAPPASDTPEAPVAPTVPPQLNEAAPGAADAHWPEIVERLLPDLEVSQRGFFQSGEQTQASLAGEVLTVRAANPFVYSRIRGEDIKALLARKATVVLGREVRVKLEVAGTGGTAGRDPLQDLADRARSLGDEHITVK